MTKVSSLRENGWLWRVVAGSKRLGTPDLGTDMLSFLGKALAILVLKVLQGLFIWAEMHKPFLGALPSILLALYSPPMPLSELTWDKPVKDFLVSCPLQQPVLGCLALLIWGTSPASHHNCM